MASTPFSRRQFLAGAAGAGVTVATMGGLSGRAFGAVALRDSPAAALTGITRQPPVPPTYHSYISRPDIAPPGVSISAISGFAEQAGQPPYIFLTPRPNVGSTPPKGQQQGLMILDVHGSLVWWQQISASDPNPFNLRVQRYMGENVLTWFAGKAPAGVGVSGSYPIVDSTYTQIAETSAVGYPSDLHEFLITPQNTALLTAYEATTGGSTPPLISHAQEVDIVTGDLLFDWASLPAVPTSQSYTSPAAGQPWDYFHINSIDLWPGSARNLLISSRNTSTVYLIDRATHDIIWRLGGKSSSFKLGTGVPFSFQHDARALADGSGISLYDDQSGVPGKYGSGKVIALNQTTKSATLQHQYFHTTEQVNSPYTGNNQLLPYGGHLVDFGGTPYFSVFGPSGNDVTAPMIFDGRFPDNVFTYRSFMADWVGYPPVSEIGFAVITNAGTGHFTAHCSWNGATEIASWQVHVGASEAHMRPEPPVARQGFETSVPITYNGAQYFQATALDANGNALGDSPLVTLS